MERVRNEISAKNKYWISKHRYLELKHFCLQYPEWKRAYIQIENLPSSKSVVNVSNAFSDGYFLDKIVLQKTELARRMEMIETAAKDTDSYLASFIFLSVTEGMSYTALRSRGMACGKDMFYDRYHKFFYILSQSR